MLKLKWNYKLAIALNTISLMLIIKEVLIGETILGNVIFLGSVISISLLAYDIIKKPNKTNIISTVIALTFITYAVWMFYSGRVPAGYGP